MQQPASVHRKLILSITISSLAFAGLVYAVAREEPAKDQRGPHGALNMQAQQAILDQLLPKRDVNQPPPGIDPYIWNTVVVPADNRLTPARVELGRKLFFETRLSKDGTVACATCHDVSRAFTDQRKTSEGIHGLLGQRNAPTTMNAFLMETLFLDGRAPSLEEQSKLPIFNPIEMGQPSDQAAINAIKDDPEYRRLFRAAYGAKPNVEDMARAIASFERTLVFLNSPFDRFLHGDKNAISAQARRGWALFNSQKGRCNGCHQLNPSNPLGIDNDFHNLGVAALNRDFEKLADQALYQLRHGGGVHAIDKLALKTKFSELGRFLVTADRADIGAFKTLQLRNVGITAPYMHNGSMKTLWDVMDHYNKGGTTNAFLDGGIVPLDLSEREINDIVAFLFTLTDNRFRAENQEAMAEQRHIALVEKKRPFRDTAMAEGKILPFQRRALGTSKNLEELEQ